MGSLSRRESVECFMRRFVPNVVATLMGSYCEIRPFPTRIESHPFRGAPRSFLEHTILTGSAGQLLVVGCGAQSRTRLRLLDADGTRVVEQAYAPLPLNHSFWCVGVLGRDRAWFEGVVDMEEQRDGKSACIYAVSLPALEIVAQHELIDSTVRALKWDPITDSIYFLKSDRISATHSVVCADARSLQFKWERSIQFANLLLHRSRPPRALTVQGQYVYVAYDDGGGGDESSFVIVIDRCSTCGGGTTCLERFASVSWTPPVEPRPPMVSWGPGDRAVLDICPVPNEDDHIAIFHGCPDVHCTVFDLTALKVVRVVRLTAQNMALEGPPVVRVNVFNHHFTVVQDTEGQKLYASTIISDNNNAGAEWTKLILS
jgi:hypothetical protein